LASTGHRARVDARGQPSGWAPGLTRTSDRAAGAPFREGRGRCAFGAGAWCATPKASPIVRQDKERWRADRPFASGPVPCRFAGRGHRRGLDGPSMPKTLFKNGGGFSQHGEVLARQGGLGLGSQARPARRGPSPARAPRCRARPARSARSEVDERPSDSRPSRPGSDARQAGEPSPSPACRTRNLGQHEAAMSPQPS
jgi:hypothetical protein